MIEREFLNHLAVLKDNLNLDESGYDELEYEQMLNEFMEELTKGE